MNDASLTPNGLYILITGATVIGYGLANPHKERDLINPILIAAIVGALIGRASGSAWRGAAISSGLTLAYQWLDDSYVKALGLPKGA